MPRAIVVSMRKNKVIKFKAEATTTVGTIVRHFGKAGKFWKVVRIENGVATAVTLGFGPDCRVACC